MTVVKFEVELVMLAVVALLWAEIAMVLLANSVLDLVLLMEV